MKRRRVGVTKTDIEFDIETECQPDIVLIKPNREVQFIGTHQHYTHFPIYRTMAFIDNVTPETEGGHIKIRLPNDCSPYILHRTRFSIFSTD